MKETPPIAIGFPPASIVKLSFLPFFLIGTISSLLNFSYHKRDTPQLLTILRQNKQSSSKDKPVVGAGMNTFLSSVAVLLSAIALGGAGFTLSQIFQLQQSFSQLNASVQNSVATSESLPVTNSTPELPPVNNIATVPSPQPTQQVNTEIQPGQFVQYAFKNEARVELLSVKRIQNPETGARDVVNVKIRVYRLGGGVTDMLSLDRAMARNPDTSETYESYNEVVEEQEKERAKREGTEVDRSTGAINLGLIKEGASADGYVWMSIPEEVTQIDLFFPQTAGFLKVPISP